MKHRRIRYLLAPVALWAAALVFANVVTTPGSQPQALRVLRAAGQTEVPAGTRIDGTRSSLSYLKASNADASDAFGSAVALSRDGTTLVVGADLEAGDAGGVNGNQHRNGLPGAGAVYVFSRAASGWSQQAYLKAPRPEAGAGFGMAVALSDDGHTVAVGAPFETSAQGEGAVHVFRRTHGQWLPQARLLPAPGGEAHLFGVRVALSGDGAGLAVGAREGPVHSARGSVHVFAQASDRWTPSARLEATTPTRDDGFGHSLAWTADGTTLAVGARPAGVKPAVPTSHPAVVHVFGKAASGWALVTELPLVGTSSTSLLSTEVTLSADGRRLVVGVHDSAGATGEVRVFDRQPGAWRQAATLHNPEAGRGFGESLALSADGRRLAVSALHEAGAVYLFDLSARDPVQTQRLSAVHGGSGDLFGAALSLSRDGRWLATGARLEDGGNSGIDARLTSARAPDSGAVYVYAPP